MGAAPTPTPPLKGRGLFWWLLEAGDGRGNRDAGGAGSGGYAERAGRRIEQGLLRAVRSGRFGFEELKQVALSVLEEIAAGAVRSGAASVGGVGGSLLTLAGAALGLPGRATGGPVSPGRAYVVGERGPELFVPTASGQVMANGGAGGRDVRVNIAVQGRGEGFDNARMLARSARQVARAVRGVLNG